MTHLRLDTGQPDRVTIWIDVAERPVNVLFESVFEELKQNIDEVLRRELKLPVVLRSAKCKGFVVGADLRRILAIEKNQEIQNFLLVGQEALEDLEQLEVDTVAFIQGSCLGGGLELALACRYRIACDMPQTQLGLPEAKLGLIPGWGGTQRLIETVGIEMGMQMLMTGDPVDAKTALRIGLVDAIADEHNSEEVVTGFLQLLHRGLPPAVRQHRATSAPGLATPGELFDGWKRSQSRAFSAAQLAILKAVGTGITQSRESGFRSERELFYPLLTSPIAREALQRFADSRS